MSTAATAMTAEFVQPHHSPARRDDDEVEQEREYLVSRATSELEATMRAACIEAEIAHNALTRRYLARCRDCATERTPVCVSCRFRHVCEASALPSRYPLADVLRSPREPHLSWRNRP